VRTETRGRIRIKTLETKSKIIDEISSSMEEERFVTAFNNLKYNFQKIKLSILDLGCGNTNNLHFLNKNSGLKNKLVAVDKGIIYDEGHLEYSDYSNLEASKYFESCNDQFDIIILSNFLHLFEKEKSREILDQCIQRIEPEGIIYILVANPNHRGWEEKSKYKTQEEYTGPLWGMTIEDLNNFIKPLKIIYSNQSENHSEIFCKIK
jgi:SAM-dependent methyltransferase